MTIPADPLNSSHILDQYVERNYKDINCPAVIISQLQRSGGSLLSQLMDGHEELYVHPSELHIGRPNKYYWPNLNLMDNEEQLFESLWEHTTFRHSLNGYQKSQINKDIYPFIFFPELQKKIFIKSVIEKRKKNGYLIDQRSILDSYITSYFNSWLDYKRSSLKHKYWVSFVARTFIHRQNIRSFFNDYPDGKIIQIIREPKSWYASAKYYMPDEYLKIDKAINLWIDSTTKILCNAKYFQNIKVILFEDLVLNTKGIMEELCSFIGIDNSKILQTPTFNCEVIASNSSFSDTKGIVNRSSALRRPLLSTTQLNYIDCYASPIYSDAKKYTESIN